MMQSFQPLYHPSLDTDWTLTADPEELFGDFNTLSSIRSIRDDIEDLNSDNFNLLWNDLPNFDNTSMQNEIVNYNCMWSGKYSPVNISCATMSPTDSITCGAVSLAAITGNGPMVIKSEPLDETEIQPKTTISRQSNQQQQQQQQLTNQQCMQKIPPGTSLLLNPRKTTQQQTQQQQQIHKKVKAISNSIQIPKIAATEFLRDRDLIASSASPTFGRPDTPNSLDDDATEFKHSYDLKACVMGSNNISLLDGDESVVINRLREQLEDTNKKIVPNQNGSSLADVLSVIQKDSINSSNFHIKEEEDDENDSDFNRQYSGYTHHMPPALLHKENSAGDSDFSDDDEDSTLSLSKRSDCSSSSIVIGNTYQMKHSDHSYTRSRDGIEDISTNLDTPSDSDEEIDVVSLGDKKLPTNPSDKDRRAIQTKVAHKFSSARIVKTPNGIRTIPPRQRVSYDLPYTPASVSPVKSGSSLANSRYPSPASTPYSSSQYSSSSSSSSSSKYHHHSSSLSSRKRNGNGSNYDGFMPPSKRHRGKKQKTPASVTIKRHYSIDEVDTIEKRNLHNDMERQRRIGLKNLFEALKKQIPSIKDKERAPKVNILREAAKLCENLTHEEQHLSYQKDMLREQLRKRQEILNQLRLTHNAARGC